MPDRVFYPIRDVTLRGTLAGARATLCGISSVWAYKEKAYVTSGLALAAYMILTSAIKEWESTGGITLDAGEVRAVCGKSASDLSAEMVLSALLSCAVQKTAQLQAELRVSGDVQATTEKWLNGMRAELMLGAVMQDVAEEKATKELASKISLTSDMRSTEKHTDAVCQELSVLLQSEVIAAMRKDAVLGTQSVTLQASVSAVVVRYRMIKDLYGMTFEDVLSWDMHKFYCYDDSETEAASAILGVAQLGEMRLM